MAQDVKLLALAKDGGTAGACARAGFRTEALEAGSPWLAVVDKDSATEVNAEALSKAALTTTVWWSIHTAVDQVWIKCFENGGPVREIRYSSEEGWATNTGQERAFEGSALKAWLEKKQVRASPDGYDILDCFLGHDRPPVTDVAEPHANAAFLLPAPLVAEAAAVAGRKGVALSAVLQAAWEIAKTDLLQRLASPPALDDESPSVTLAPPSVPPGFEAPLVERSPLPTGDKKVHCKLVMDPAVVEELRSMVMAFDRSASWLLGEAYVVARGRMAGMPVRG